MAELRLPDAELEVLACLWKHGAITVRQLREAMRGYRPLTHAAVSTLLHRLREKGMVTRRKGAVGKAFLYQAAVRPRRTYRQIAEHLMQRVFGGNALALVSALYESHPPTQQELDRLQEFLDELRQRRGGKGKSP